MRIHVIISTVILVSSLLSCNIGNKGNINGERNAGFDRAGMDTTVKPGDNFFQYANGQWVKTAVIPDDQSGTGSFFTLYQENLKKLKTILEQSAKGNKPTGSMEQKVGDYFSSGMDTLSLEKIGASPLKPALDKIDAVKNYNELVAVITQLTQLEDSGLMGFYVGADDKKSERNILILTQSGLSLPERDYYFRKDSATLAARNGLVKYANTLFFLTGADSVSAAKESLFVLSLESAIAAAHRTPVALRDPQANYNKMSLAQLELLSPNVGWKKVLSAMHISTDTVNVSQPAYFKALSALLKSQPIEVWKAKVKYDYISGNASLLSKSFSTAAFDFNKIFNGQKKQSDRWKTMVNSVDRNLGELLGQLYVQQYFTPESKQRMDELVTNLQNAFKTRIQQLDWMSDSTKEKATKKLTAFLKKIGYPNKWKNYDDVVVDPKNYFSNAKSASAHRYHEMIAKVDKLVDRTDWGMTPPTVNAYYNPGNNEIVFPAGILQFPFFDAQSDDAINYGGIGMVIGHEMTHGFDDQGSQYDEVGNLKNWWGKSDAVKFKEKTGAAVQQYNGFTVLDSLHVNGQLTLGENLADIGGLAIAYDAFKLTKQGRGNELIDGFTPDQRFFLGFAQVWRIKNRVEQIRARITTDPHSPEMYRINGPTVNFTPFYAAFGVKPGDKMYVNPEQRVKIW
jgi:putative endopeptidase